MPWLLALLNPLNWLRIASVVKTALSAINIVLQAIRDRAVRLKKESLDKAFSKLKAADKIKDDQLRIKEKADAMCSIEKISNPDSTCDSDSRT